MCLTSCGRASCWDAWHPVPMMHYAAPRLHAGAWFAESVSQVTHLHRLKVLTEVRHRHPDGDRKTAEQATFLKYYMWWDRSKLVWHKFELLLLLFLRLFTFSVKITGKKCELHNNCFFLSLKNVKAGRRVCCRKSPFKDKPCLSCGCWCSWDLHVWICSFMCAEGVQWGSESAVRHTITPQTHQNSPSSRLTLPSLCCSSALTVFHSGLQTKPFYHHRLTNTLKHMV